MFDRAIGLARSLAIYHALPGRQRRMRRLYADFLRSGDLVFDIGAHVGNHVRAFAALGCRVVAVEPQPEFSRLLRVAFARFAGVKVIEAAVSDTSGSSALAISDRTPTVATLDSEWREARTAEPEFAGVRWNRQVAVRTTTLDELIDLFGDPAFIKIDVEGSEPAVLAGLNRPVRGLSFEYLPRALGLVETSLGRLRELGHYQFNWSAGESFRFASSTWMNERQLIASLKSAAAQGRSGDVYARL